MNGVPRNPTAKYLGHGLVTVCCPKAEKKNVFCVCTVVVTCPDHGEEHHGTHD